MTIEYKDSKRIVALSTDTVETPTYSDDFSSYSDQTAADASWITNSTTEFRANPTNDNLDIDGGLGTSSALCTKDFGAGNISDTKWVLRFDINVTEYTKSTLVGNEHSMLIGLSDTNADIWNSSHDSITIGVYYSKSEAVYKIASANGTSHYSGTRTNTSTIPSVDHLWFELIRTSATGATLNIYTDEYVTLDSTTSITVSSTCANLRYFHLNIEATGNPNGNYVGVLDNIKLFNGITSLTSRPTDVQDNSLLVEKDTANRYWRTGDSGLTAQEQSSDAELQDLNSGAKGMGEYVRSTSSKLYGKILTDVQFYLKKGTPQAGAKVYARHYNSSDVLIHTYWEKLASDLPTSLTWTTETTLSGDTVFANGDYFVIEYTKTDGTSATGSVSTNRKDDTNANQWDGSNSGYINTYFGSSSYLDTSNRDIWFKGTTATPATWTMQPTFEHDYSNSTGWTEVGTTSNITGGVWTSNGAGNNGDHGFYKPLGFTLNDEKWYVEFDIKQTGSSVESGVPLFFSAGTAKPLDTSHDALGITATNGGAVELWKNTAGTGGTGSGATALTVDTQYYGVLIRTSTTNLQLKFYTDSARTSQHGSTVDFTISSGITGLNTIQHRTTDNGSTSSGTSNVIDNVKVYNGVTSIN